MKTIFTFLGIGKKIQYFLVFTFLCTLSFISNGQVTATEEFENEVAANTGAVFSESGINFNTTFKLVTYSGNFGYNNSPKFLEIARVGSTPATATTTATISLNTATNPGIGFKINSFAAYTAANNGGTMPINGIVTFTGTPLGGGPQVTVDVPVQSASGTPPAGQSREANGMVNGLTLGNTFNNLYFTTLTISIIDNDLGSSTIGTSYLGLDHINFTTQAPITNNYAIGPASITEGNTGTSILSYQVNRSSGTAIGSVQIQSSNVTATAGSDYVALPLTTINFPIGNTTQTVNVTINGDTGIEPNETFNMTLSNPTGGTIATGTGVVTITDDDQFAEIFDDEVHNSTTFSQNGVNFQATGKLDVNVGGSFGAGGSTGYSASMEPFATGNQGSFVITSPGKSFYLTSVDLWSAVVSGTGPNWTFTPTNCTVTFTGTKFDGTGTITHTAAITPTQTTNPDRDVYTTVNFAGTPLANINLSSIAFSVPSPINYLQIDNFKYGVTGSAATQVSINDVSVLEGTGGGASNIATFTVTRTANNTGFTVDLASSNGSATAGVDYTAYPTTTLNFTNGGALSQTVTVPILKDASIEPNETFNMTLSNATNGTLYLKQVGVGTILEDDKICETFDTDVQNATTFSENGIAFTSTNRLKVTNSGNSNGNGSNASPGFLISGVGTAGSLGKIILSGSGRAFKLASIDAWVGSGTSGQVTFNGTLFGGGVVSAIKTVTNPVTPTTGPNANRPVWQQNITFTGTTLDNVLLTELEIVVASPLTICDIDNFCYAIFNTLPIIEVTDAGNVNIPNGGAATTTNNTDFGAACVTGSLVSKTYTIKNTGAVNLVLPAAPNVIIGGTNANQFSITSNSGTPIVPGGSSSFIVVFDPTSAGLKNATLTISSNDATNNPFVINIKGTGNANPDATITANNSVCQLATLNLSVPTGASTYVWSGDGVVLANSNATTAVPSSIGSQTYKVVVTSSVGCTSTGTKIVVINAKPNLSGGPSQTICNGTSTYILGQCIFNVFTTLSGANEVPANGSTATGYAYGTFNTITNALSLTVNFTGLAANANAAHIHGSGTSNSTTTAPVIIDFAGLFPTATSGSFTYNAIITPTNANYLLLGNAYVNIHNTSFGGGEIRGQLTASCAADNFVWNPGNLNGLGTTVSPINLGANTYTLTATNSTTGCFNTTSVTVNVDPITLPTGSTVNGQEVGNVPLVSNACEYVAKVIPTSGFTNATVKSWIEANSSSGFVPRHYEITPSTNPGTSTGTVTLFFKQSDFNTYNGTITSGLLPTGPMDAAGILNFQLQKFAGTSPNGLGYSGSPTLIPGTGNAWNTGAYTFVWNAANLYWEVTFPVNGFSGFLAKSAAQNPLPVSLLLFTGKATESGNELAWKTSEEKNFDKFEIQRSINTQAFEKIGEVKSNEKKIYVYLDRNPPLEAVRLYRLKIIDLDGTFTFSKIISIENDFEKSNVGEFYPNPSNGNEATVNVTSTEAKNWTITSYDLAGRILKTENRFLNKGENKVKIKLEKGINFQIFRFENGSEMQYRKLINQ